MKMPDWLAARAALAPERLALAAGATRLTFAELDKRASSAARRLAGLGMGAGDRVACVLRDGPAMAELVHGAGRAGAILVPLNVRLSAVELTWQLADAQARVLIHDDSTRQVAEAATTAGVATGENGRPSNIATLDLGAFAGLPESAVALRERVDLDAVHTIIYTSGTTGTPKGAMLTYGNHWWSAVGSALNLGLRDDDRWLAPLPLFHVGGLSIVLRSVIYGIPALVLERFEPEAVNRAIDADGATIVSVVATMLQRMLDARGDRGYAPTLRHVLLGGGPAPLPLLQECARRGVPVVQTYGLTETASQAVTLAPADALRKVGSAGKPLLPNELRIERDGQPVPHGEAGEIVLRGPTVTPGYTGRPEETARALQGGWLHTGDIGRLDDEGYLYVLDRRDDLIICGGENVYPAEIESTLLAHPAVADAGVVGEPDREWGQTPVAYVVLQPGAGAAPDELIAYCRTRLARYKVPARLYLCGALPRNAAGKLQRHKLAAIRSA